MGVGGAARFPKTSFWELPRGSFDGGVAVGFRDSFRYCTVHTYIHTYKR